MKDDHALVLITCGSDSEARTIARHLVSHRLAAGVQMLPIESIYTWQDELVEDDEVLLVCKTRADRFEEIEKVVDQLHSYEVPPDLTISIDRARSSYLAWIDAATGGA